MTRPALPSGIQAVRAYVHERGASLSATRTYKQRDVPLFEDNVLLSFYYASNHTVHAQLTVPALQRVARRACVACGVPAELYCARCELTPYCGARCQRADWQRRHRSVCHNLMRLSKPEIQQKPEINAEPDVSMPPAAPLRKPHSPVTQAVKRDPAPQVNQKHVQHNGESKPPQQHNRSPRNDTSHNIKIHETGNQSTRSSGNLQPKPSSNQHNSKPNMRFPRRPDPDSPREPTKEEPSYPEKNSAPEVKPAPVAKAEPVAKTEPVAKANRVKKDAAPKTVRSIGSVGDVTPVRKIVPKTCLLDTISVGDSLMISPECNASECNTKQGGLVCLCLNVDSEEAYQRLCGEFGELCEKDSRDYTPTPGELFAYFDAAEEAWYRARCLSKASAALIDSCRVASIGDKARALPAGYEAIPEFCCVLNATAATVGVTYKATILSKTDYGYKVSLEDESGAPVGQGEASRWLPDVEVPKATTAPVIPDVPRPDVVNKSKVVLVEMSTLDRAMVRPAGGEAQRQYDGLLADLVLHGMRASPLLEPPQSGRVVLGKYSDGMHYRALVRRTNVKQDRYLLEYIEFGNSEVVNLKSMYPCPPEYNLEGHPTMVSVVAIQKADISSNVLTPQAEEYLQKIRDDCMELVLTIPSGANTAPSGSEACLTVAKNNESVNRKLSDMCTPEWRKLEERGADVLDTETITEDDVIYLAPPEDGCTMEVLDATALRVGNVTARKTPCKHADFVLGPLTEKITEYCNSALGKEPYLPKLYEVCVVQRPQLGWCRAVMMEHKAGELDCTVYLLDHGALLYDAAVPSLRKLLPEFVKGVPALSLQLDFNGFPKNPTPLQLVRAEKFLELDEHGRGTLRVKRCKESSHGVYTVDVPELIAAIGH